MHGSCNFMAKRARTTTRDHRCFPIKINDVLNRRRSAMLNSAGNKSEFSLLCQQISVAQTLACTYNNMKQSITGNEVNSTKVQLIHISHNGILLI